MKILLTIIIASITLSVVQASSTMSPDGPNVHLSDHIAAPTQSQHVDADGARLFAMLTPAMHRPSQPKQQQPQQLSLEDRIAYQRAIEEVYWRHRIWPKENSGVKPSLNQVLPRAEIEKKVQNYLRDSQMLEQHWHQPINPEQLQAEINRIASHTKQPEVLREIFAALANDPAVIAECVARPALAERLLTQVNAHEDNPKWSANTQKPPLMLPGLTLAWMKEPLDARRANGETRAPIRLMAAKPTRYRMPAITDTPSGCAANWTATNLTDAPDPRGYHTAVWTGSEMIIWGGYNGPPGLNTGGKYNPATDIRNRLCSLRYLLFRICCEGLPSSPILRRKINQNLRRNRRKDWSHTTMRRRAPRA
jgi:hypothetical protein